MTSEINKEITRSTINSVEHSNHFVSISSTTHFVSGGAVTRVKQWRSEDNYSPASSAQVTKAIHSPIGFNHALRNKFAFTVFLKLAKEVATLIPSKSFFFTELIKYA
jgi:hypothetical protein